MFRALVAAVVLAVSSPALAQSPEAELKAAEQAMQKFARDTQAFEAIIVDASALADRALARVDEAIALSERKATRREVDRWSESWAPQIRKDMAGLKQRLKDLPPIQTRELEQILGPSSLEYIRIARMARDFPSSSSDALSSIEDLCETIATLGPKAAAGDDAAMLRLGLSMIEGGRTMIQVELVSVSRSLAALPSDHPQYQLLSSVSASNQGVILILDAAVAEVLDDDFDRKSAADKIRASGQEALDHARKIPEAAKASLAGIRRSEVGESDLARRVERGFANYPEAAKVEEDLAMLILQVAATLAKRGDLLERMDNELAPIERLIDERGRLDSERRAAIAQ